MDTAIKQLDRDGKTLIKADLIAIIIGLKPEYMNMINELQTKFTVEDLNALIRTIIYDPQFIQKQQNSQSKSYQSIPKESIKYLK